MFLEVEPIDIKKLDHDIKYVNRAFRLLTAQMEENIRKASIPKEEGEAAFRIHTSAALLL